MNYTSAKLSKYKTIDGNNTMLRLPIFALAVLLSIASPLLNAQLLNLPKWRSEPLSEIDQQFMREQRESVDDLVRRHFGRQLNGQRQNDIAVMQRLLDEKIVGPEQTVQLQAMGIILGQLLKAEKGLNWVIYFDRYGRSRSLQVPGFDKEFIFPVTQISRKAEVGIRVDINQVYRGLEQSIEDIRNKPPF